MIEAITYAPDLAALIEEMAGADSEFVTVEDGGVRLNVDKTPIVHNSGESLALVRVPDLTTVDFSGLQVLASDDINGDVWAVLFADVAATAIYDRVYDQTPTTYTDDDNVDHTHTPPRQFGVFA